MRQPPLLLYHDRTVNTAVNTVNTVQTGGIQEPLIIDGYLYIDAIAGGSCRAAVEDRRPAVEFTAQHVQLIPVCGFPGDDTHP